MKLASLLVFSSLLLSAQVLERFEVATVKPVNRAAPGQMQCGGGPGSADPLRFTCTNAPLRLLLSIAFGVQFYQMDGPEWISRGDFDIVAAIPPCTPPAAIRVMLQHLLEERVSLKWHRESRELPVYVLGVAKGGPKVKASAPDTATAVTSGGRGDGMLMTARGYRMGTLASMLSVQFQTQVYDETGLQGGYDFELHFAPPQVTGTTFESPSLFTALTEQLGLTLRSEKRPVQMIVVDSASQVPTEN